MAFDQNSAIPKDLRPVNVPGGVNEEPRVAPATTTGRIAGEVFYSNPVHDAGSPQSIPMFYPATISDAGYGGLGYGNAIPTVAAAWYPRASVPSVGHMGVNPALGFGYSSNLGTSRAGGNPVDQVGNEVATTSFGLSHNLGPRFAGNAVDHVANEVSTSGAIGTNLVSGRIGGSTVDPVVNKNVGGIGFTSSVADRVSGNGLGQAESNLGIGALHKSDVKRSSGSGVDQVSEGGEDSVSGKKVKFLCSFGGKILPRPSDGMLRYVGGQTRIISVRRDVSYSELVLKMVDIYGQPVVIKYQLPDEDLDALVSVSCPDDLENMMEEYEKLVERSSDGSAKLRVFLFSASELDPSGIIQFGDLHDSGQRYVEAVNGMMDGIGGGITRKESIASATSTQNSDVSGSEAVDSSGLGQTEFSKPASTSIATPIENSPISNDTSKSFFVDPSPIAHSDSSTVGFENPVVQSSASLVSSLQSESDPEKSMPPPGLQQPLTSDLQHSGVNISSAGPYGQPFMDPSKEMNQAVYVPHSPVMGFPNPHLFGSGGPVYAPQQFPDNSGRSNAHQFVTPVHMTLSPASSQLGVRHTYGQPLMHPQQMHLEHNDTSGQRFVLLPVEQGHRMYQMQAHQAVGGYGWHPVFPLGQVMMSDGSKLIQQDKMQRPEECNMCQKALPHAHSDSLAQEQRDSKTGPESGFATVYHSLPPADIVKAFPVNKDAAIGALGHNEPGQGSQSTATVHSEVFSQDLKAQLEHERTIFPRTNPDPRKHVVGLTSNEQPHYGVFGSPLPQSSPSTGARLHPVPAECQYKQEIANKLVNVEACPGQVPIQTSEQQFQELPKEYYQLPVIVSSGNNMDSPDLGNHARFVDGRMENLHISTPEMLAINDRIRLPSDEYRSAEMSKQRPQPNPPGEMLQDTASSKHKIVPEGVTSAELSTYSVNEAPYMHDFQASEPIEGSQQSSFGIPRSHSQSKMGVQMDPQGIYYGSPAFSGVGSAFPTEGISLNAAWMDDTSLFQPTMVPSEDGVIALNGNMPSSLPPPSRSEDLQDSSNSLFVNQDPFNMRSDAHFPPPIPVKIALRKEALGTRDPFLDNQLGMVDQRNSDLGMEDGMQQPFGTPVADTSSELLNTSKEERIRQELQDVAEGVAASVLQSVTSNPDLSVFEGNEPDHETILEKEVTDDTEPHGEANAEDLTTKLQEKVNFGFPVSDGIGRLQIIKNTDLEELRELGSGTYGTVYHGKWRGTDVAIKRINDRCFTGKPSEQERMRYDFWNEAIKLADLHHPNVVAFYGVVLDGPGGSVATVTEYMVNGSLRTALQKSERNLDKRKRLLIAMDVAFGMEYLHGKNIVHFDLKSDNLLVNLRDPHRPICKVGDLGLSKVKCQTLISGGVRGTLPWMAPELLNGSSSLVSEKVDVFSFGIVMWELLTGEEPYADLHYGAIIGGIVSNTLRPPVPESCDEEWRSLMERCWSSEPSERPSFTEIANELRCMSARSPPKQQNHT